MSAATAHLHEHNTRQRDAAHTELHPELNRAHVRFINLGKTYNGTVHGCTALTWRSGVAKCSGSSGAAARANPR
ncbi:MAG: hypothetical protein GAK32_01889 [Pseudomonas fluorescens]|nr:MAG: hypothetical protein GAK32_01889 [Pseudomonas fluorescens]